MVLEVVASARPRLSVDKLLTERSLRPHNHSPMSLAILVQYFTSTVTYKNCSESWRPANTSLESIVSPQFCIVLVATRAHTFVSDIDLINPG